MPRRLEKSDFTTPQAIALEIAAAGLLALRYRSKRLPRYDGPSQSEPEQTPLSDIVDDNPVYVTRTSGNGFKMGIVRTDADSIGISGNTVTDDEGKESIKIDEEYSETEPENLLLLLSAIETVRKRWGRKRKFL